MATRRIGFRLAALVTINDTSVADVQRATTTEGTGNHTLMLRVNGAAIAARGANLIPMELLEGRIVPGMHTNLVASAAAANFNTIRVWGGGTCASQVFFL
jgi:beta-mannosidase